MKNITIVIPNYNGIHLLGTYLPSIISFCPGVEILIIDDASTDLSVQMLNDNFPRVRVIHHTKNTGFSETVNDGFKHANSEYILLLNSDVSLEKNIIPQLLKHFDDPKVFGIGCLQHTVTGTTTMEEGSGTATFQKGFLLHKKGNISKENTLWIFGGAGMFRRSIWEKLGGLEKLYQPFYWEDIDISYRALKSGFRILFDPKVSVVHHRGESSIQSSYSQKWITVVSYRNQYFFVWLNISDKNLLLQHFFYLPIHVLRSLFSFDLSHLKGFFWAITYLPQILHQRNRNKKRWKTTDNEILNEVHTG